MSKAVCGCEINTFHISGLCDDHANEAKLRRHVAAEEARDAGGRPMSKEVKIEGFGAWLPRFGPQRAFGSALQQAFNANPPWYGPTTVAEMLKWKTGGETVPWFAPTYVETPTTQLILTPPAEPCWGCYTGEDKAAHSCVSGGWK